MLVCIWLTCSCHAITTPLPDRGIPSAAGIQVRSTNNEEQPYREVHNPDLNRGIFIQNLGGITLSGCFWTIISTHEVSSALFALNEIITSLEDFEENVNDLDWRVRIDHVRPTIGELRRTVEDEQVRLAGVKQRALNLKRLYTNIERTVYQGITGHTSKLGKRAVLPIVGDALQFLFGVQTTSSSEDLHRAVMENAKSNEKVVHLMNRQATIIKKIQFKLMKFRHPLQK